MEIRHHNESTIQALLKRARKEIKIKEHLEMLERYHKYMRVQGHTLGTIYTNLNKSLLFLNYVEALGKTIDKITFDEIQDYLSTKGKPSTVRRYITAIRGLAKANAQYKPLFLQLVKQIKLPRVKQKLPQLPKPEDVEKLIMNARQPYKAIIAILYEGGLRRCEALNLRYGDVEPWDVGYRVWVRKSKSLPRVVFIVKYAHVLRDWLLQHRSKHPNDWLFYNTYGEPIRSSTLSTYIRRLAKRLGLNPDLLHPHNLRHLRATELYKSRKLTELELMKLFGWKTRTMIDVYSKITMDDVEERMRELYGVKTKASESREEKVICSNCGMEVPVGWQYCPRCGKPLSEKAVAEKIVEGMRLEEKAKMLLKMLAREIRKDPSVMAKILDALYENRHNSHGEGEVDSQGA